jgi:ribosomal 30S subunit maturation factor RimM
LRGEVVVALNAGDPERLLRIRVVAVGRDPAVTERIVESVRPHRTGGLVKFEGIESPEAARSLAGAEIYADVSALPALEPGTFYHFQSASR